MSTLRALRLHSPLLQRRVQPPQLQRQVLEGVGFEVGHVASFPEEGLASTSLSSALDSICTFNLHWFECVLICLVQ